MAHVVPDPASPHPASPHPVSPSSVSPSSVRGDQIVRDRTGPTPLRPADAQALLLLAEELLCAPDPATAGARLLDAVVGTFGFSRAVLLAAPDGRLPVLASHGLSAATPRTGRCDSRVVVTALERGTSALLRDLDPAQEPWLAQLLPAGADLLVVPLTHDGRRYGALLLQAPVLRDVGWLTGVLIPLERAAACAARTLRTLWRVEHLERLAATDDLTMIANRRTFTFSLERELARSVRSGEPVSLVILDLDGFKAVNDIYGHPAGDEALRNVAASLSIACRDLDTPARYGGEEFVVILPGCDEAQSMEIAERLRAAIALAPAVTPLTASAGLATFPEHAVDVDGLVQVADDALLVSKRNGRNRTTRARSAETIHLVPRLLELTDLHQWEKPGEVAEPLEAVPTSARGARC